MLYRFEKGNPVGICRVKDIQVTWYDMEHGGYCFDESFIRPIHPEMERILAYVETEEDEGKRDRSRVFVNFDNGDRYELVMRKVQFRCSNFREK